MNGRLIVFYRQGIFASTKAHVSPPTSILPQLVHPQDPPKLTTSAAAKGLWISMAESNAFHCDNRHQGHPDISSSGK